MNPEPCLSVVIPCFNEAATVGEVVGTVLDSPWVGEVVIVDDGSTDGTTDGTTETEFYHFYMHALLFTCVCV